ncbi:C-terminal-binding protein [Strongyloides ratti]|uniref:C-terminal-binding protein n=1 Tax=Strongyloides ratti TaxID=34506 RepID=A0A090KQ51_STRRB|nr:C-terminal-binding protein [Strongyloides ratti]CEF59509.1 C-terminal-binding protein [Strongyloides ratti]
MPTTCGFPNCKFRSRYRGQEDNRHFYRIPKRPQVLRQRWLNAIGRTEETVVSQLRICSAHFEGGEKKEGDIPVPDPLLDKPLSIKLPPKESKSIGEKRRRINTTLNNNNNSNNNNNNNNDSINNNNQNTNSPKNNILDTHTNGSQQRNNSSKQKGNDIINYTDYKRKCINQDTDSRPSSCNPLIKKENSIVSDSNCQDSDILKNNNLALLNNNSSIFGTPNSSIFGNQNSSNFGQIFPNLKFLQYPYFLPNMATTRTSLPHRPLVALLDGRDCSVEMPILKEVATVAFCDAQTISEVHAKVFNEAVAALIWQNMKLGREELEKFKSLKIIVRIGTVSSNIDVNAATELGIAVCSIGQDCIEEIADSTLSMILNLYRRTYFVAKYAHETSRAITMEQLKSACEGATKINGSTLGLVGLGRVAIAVVQRAKAFGFKIKYYDPIVPPGLDKALGIKKADTLEELFKTSDCISLHCPYNENTRYLINENTLKIMKKGVFIVNTSSGSLIHERSLAEALARGDVKAAALDCHEIEPFDSSTNILSKLPNVINTPNTCWYSSESCKELRIAAANEIKLAIIGRFPGDLENCINKNELLLNTQKSNISNSTNLLRRNIQPIVNNFTPKAPMSPMHTTINSSTESCPLGNISDPISVSHAIALSQRVQEKIRNSVPVPNVSINAGFRFPTPLMMGLNPGVSNNNNINLLMRNGFNNFQHLISGVQQSTTNNSVPNLSGTPSPNPGIASVLNSLSVFKKEQIDDNIDEDKKKNISPKLSPISHEIDNKKCDNLLDSSSENTPMEQQDCEEELLKEEDNINDKKLSNNDNMTDDDKVKIYSEDNIKIESPDNILNNEKVSNNTNDETIPISTIENEETTNNEESTEAPLDVEMQKNNWSQENEENISKYDEKIKNCDNVSNDEISYTNDSQ